MIYVKKMLPKSWDGLLLSMQTNLHYFKRKSKPVAVFFSKEHISTKKHLATLAIRFSLEAFSLLIFHILYR
jgi:hypothetical protein